MRGGTTAVGASAVNMDAECMATTEALTRDNVKQQVVANDGWGTVTVSRVFHSSARVARNSVSEQIAEISPRPCSTFADVAHLAFSSRGREQALSKGDVEGMWWASRAQGLIHEVAGCHEVVDTILTDAHENISGRIAAQLR